MVARRQWRGMAAAVVACGALLLLLQLPSARCQGLEYCDPALWDNGAASTWTGDVKVLPSLNGQDTYPDSYAWMQMVFEPGLDESGKPKAEASVTTNLMRKVDYKPEYSEPPMCSTKYSYACTKSTGLTITPVCNFLNQSMAQLCGCTGASAGSNCKEVGETPGCYFFQDPLAVSKMCSTACTGFFWCEHFLLSYETTSFSLLIEQQGEMADDNFTMKMTTAGKFVSGCGATSKDSYQLQAFLYSGSHANPFVNTPWQIILGCAGGLLAILGGGWVVFFVCARRPKSKKSADEERVESDERTLASRALCEPMMNVVEGGHEEAELRCPACHAVVQSIYDQYCTNTLCGKVYKSFSKWTQERGEVVIPNPRYQQANAKVADGE